MKNSIFVLSLFLLVALSCSKDETVDIEISPFAGKWSGTYSGHYEGIWGFEISNSGKFVSGTARQTGSSLTSAILSISITPDGYGSSIYERGFTNSFKISGDSLSGTWMNKEQRTSGTLTASRQ